MTAPGLLFNNPCSAGTVERFIERLDLSPGQTVLDVGCGRGVMLDWIIERYGCAAIGVDPRPDEIQRAREATARHGRHVTLHACGIADADLGTRPIDAGICVGATHAFAGPGEGWLAAIRALSEVVVPGGLLLLGEGYWRRDPDPAYLAATGMSHDELVTHAENVARAEAEGLTPLYATACAREDWDHFESSVWYAAENDLRARPDDPDVAHRAEHWRRWRRAYLRWGRDTLGFGLYLFRTRAGPVTPSSR